MVVFQPADAIKASGTKLTETNSKKVCGVEICEIPMTIEEKIAAFLFSLTGEKATAMKPIGKILEQAKQIKQKAAQPPPPVTQTQPVQPAPSLPPSVARTVPPTESALPPAASMFAAPPEYTATFHIEHETRYTVMQNGTFVPQGERTMSLFLNGNFRIENQKFVAPLHMISAKFFVGNQAIGQETRVTKFELTHEAKMISYDLELATDTSGRGATISGYLVFDYAIVDPTREGCYLPLDATSHSLSATIRTSVGASAVGVSPKAAGGTLFAAGTPTMLESKFYSCSGGLCGWGSYPAEASIDFNRPPEQPISLATIAAVPTDVYSLLADPPIRKSVIAKFEEMKRDPTMAGNLPVFTFSPSSITRVGDQITKTTKTTVFYESASQAGFNKWPEFIIKRGMEETNITELAKQKNPEFYQLAAANGYDPENIPKETTIEEIEGFKELPPWIIVPPNVNLEEIELDESGRPRSPLFGTQTQPQTHTITSNILIGKTLMPPKPIEWGLFYKIADCIKIAGEKFCIELYSFRFGIQFDAGLGLRLPVVLTLNSPSTFEYNMTYNDITVSLTPVDGDESFYKNVGLGGRKVFQGNEFLAYLDLFIGLSEKILGIEIHQGYSIEFHDDLPAYCEEEGALTDLIQWDPPGEVILPKQCRNFVTPFGLDEKGKQRWFPLPKWKIPPDDSGLFYPIGPVAIGLTIIAEPHVGSKTITAQWKAEGDSCGFGNIVFKGNSPTQNIGPILISDFEDDTDKASILIDKFRYHFDLIEIVLKGNINIGMFGVPGKTAEGSAGATWLLSLPDSAAIEILKFRPIPGEPTISRHEGTKDFLVELSINSTQTNTMSEPQDQWVKTNIYGR